MNVLPKFCRYVSTNVLGTISLSCYILADTFFVAASQGTSGLAALNICIPVFNVMNALGLMLGIGGGTRYAIFQAQKDEQGAQRVFSSMMLLGLGLGAVGIAVGLLLTRPLVLLLGADSETLALAMEYMHTILSFAPFFLLNNILQAFVRNDGAPQLAMAAMFTSSFSNVILDYVFMFPLGMGMFGAALATGIAPVLSLCVLGTHFLPSAKGRCRLHFSPRQFSLPAVLHAAPLGLSSFVTELSSGVVLLVFNQLILRAAGNTGVAAYGIIANLALVGIAVFTGIAQGIQPLISEAYGHSDTASLNKIRRYALTLALVLAGLFYLAVNLWAGPLVAAFNQDGDAQLAAIARHGMTLYFLGFFFAGPNIITAAFHSAVNQPRMGFWVSMIRGCIALVPLALLLGLTFGLNGVWLSYVLAEAAAFAFILVCAAVRSGSRGKNC